MPYRREESETQTTVLVIRNRSVETPLIYCDECEGLSMFLSIEIARQVLMSNEPLFKPSAGPFNVHWHLRSEDTQMVCAASLARIIESSQIENWRKL